MQSENFILLILDAFGGITESETRMQKLAFLATREYEIDLDVGFKWHYYGPYSSDLKSKFQDLSKRGLIEIEHDQRQTCMNDTYTVTRFRLTTTGRELTNSIKSSLDNNQTNKIQSIVSQYGHQELSAVLSYVYSAYTPEDL